MDWDGVAGEVGILGIFSLLIIRELLQRLEAKQVRMNGAAKAQTSRDPVLVMLEAIHHEMKDLATHEGKVLQGVMAMQQTATSAGQARDMVKDIHDAALGPSARSEDGGFKWIMAPSVASAALESRDLLKTLNGKMDEVVQATRQSRCPYLKAESDES